MKSTHTDERESKRKKQSAPAWVENLSPIKNVMV
jgi:hypothetical protein